MERIPVAVSSPQIDFKYLLLYISLLEQIPCLRDVPDADDLDADRLSVFLAQMLGVFDRQYDPAKAQPLCLPDDFVAVLYSPQIACQSDLADHQRPAVHLPACAG